jgi:accessory gene regulator protein AgrB
MDIIEYHAEFRTALFLSSLTLGTFLFTRLIFWSIAAALSNAFIQISLGYFKCTTSAIICLLTSILSWCLVAFVLFQVGKNMQAMIGYAEEDASAKFLRGEKDD